MKTLATIVTLAVAVAVAAAGPTEVGYIAPYTALEHTGAYYDDHYPAYGYAAPYGAYYGNPSGAYSYWGVHGPTVVQQNAASLGHPIAPIHAPLYAPYSGLYGAYGGPLVKSTVVQDNTAAHLAASHYWGYPTAYGAYGYGYGHGYSKYLTPADTTTIETAPLAKYVL